MTARQCLHCTAVIKTKTLSDVGHYDWVLFQAIAWLSGYCTPMCQRNAAMNAVVSKTAWWLTP